MPNPTKSAPKGAAFRARKLVCALAISLWICDPLSRAAYAGVEPTTGVYFYDTVDVAIGGLYPISIERHYQSARDDGGNVSSGPFGPGTHMGTYSLRADLLNRTQPSNSMVRLRTLTGGEQMFVPGPVPGTYVNQYPSDPLRGTVRVNGAAILLETEGGTQFNFASPSETELERATLDSIVDRFGKAVSFQYSGNQLVRVTDPFGRYISLIYSNGAFPSQVTQVESYDNASQRYGLVRYVYNAEGDLESSFNAAHGKSALSANGTNRQMNGETRYTYSGHQLVKVVDPRGIAALTNTYGGTGAVGTANKVTLQRMPGVNGSASYTSDDILNRYTYSSGNTAIRDAADAADRSTSVSTLRAVGSAGSAPLLTAAPPLSITRLPPVF